MASGLETENLYDLIGRRISGAKCSYGSQRSDCGGCWIYPRQSSPSRRCLIFLFAAFESPVKDGFCIRIFQ